jgi:hypothetical protein
MLSYTVYVVSPTIHPRYLTQLSPPKNPQFKPLVFRFLYTECPIYTEVANFYFQLSKTLHHDYPSTAHILKSPIALALPVAAAAAAASATAAPSPASTLSRGWL